MSPQDRTHANCAGAPSACPACGQSFACGAASPTCWCAGVSLGADTAARLRESYRGCLCPPCLERAARTDSDNAATAERTRPTP